jgi:transposase
VAASAHGKQRTDSTHVLAKIRALNRLLCVGETLRHALNCLATVAPEWLQAHSHPEWVERYEVRMEDARTPIGEEARRALAEVIGADGASLLYAIYDAAAPSFLQEIPAVEILTPASGSRTTHGSMARSAGALPRIFLQPRAILDHPTIWRRITVKSAVPPGLVISVHVTETCEKDAPHLITHVETTSAPVSDDARTAVIHEALKHKGLLPDQHIVDTGYVDAKLLVESQRDYELELIGPTRANYRWQAREKTGFDGRGFLIDWQAEQARCPAGHPSSSWTPAIDKRKNEVIKIKFSTKDCQACPSLRRCTKSIRHVRRTVTIRPKEQYDALQARRRQETTQDFKTLYAIRAGVEGTLSQGVRTMGLRRSRYIGQERTHLQHVATAAAINVVRLIRWLGGVPHAKTRRSAFAQLHRSAS